MKLILAVSGGVDSMALLAMYKQADIIVAHIDHGTRKSSAEDADFVRRKCQELGVKFYETKLELGEGISEELARKKRTSYVSSTEVELWTVVSEEWSVTTTFFFAQYGSPFCG